MANTGTTLAARRKPVNWATGAIGGVVGSILYTGFVETINVTANGPSAFFFPFRQIGAVVLGPRALESSYDVLTATAAGTVVHLVIAVAFGIVIAWIAARLTALGIGGLAAIGMVAGLLFYALNVFVIFPTAFLWFLSNSRLIQSLGHALFGGVTGAWIGWRRSTARAW